jgi:hypothetical protein
MNTDHRGCWPTCRSQMDAGLPAGPIAEEPAPHPARWHVLLAGLGIGMVLLGALLGGIVA